ncbi:GTP-binding protein [Pycnococcus provasolii]
MSGSGLSRVRFCVSLSRNHKYGYGLVRSCSSSSRTFASSSQSSSSTSSSTSGNTNTPSQNGQAHGAKRPELFPKGIKVQKYRCETPEELLEVPPRVLALPHVAVAGRTNVGKSSLLNMLLRKDNLARASSVQNKTRSVDFLCVNNQLVLTDLPGYPDRTHNKVWDEQLAELVDAYLSMSQGDDARFDLRAALFLFDIRWDVLLQDDAFAAFFRDRKIPMLLCLTKDDKVANHEYRSRRVDRIRSDLAWSGPHVHCSSDLSLANSRKGRKILQRYIGSFCLEADDQDEVRDILANAWGGGAKASADGEEGTRKARVEENERRRREAGDDVGGDDDKVKDNAFGIL